MKTQQFLTQLMQQYHQSKDGRVYVHDGTQYTEAYDLFTKEGHLLVKSYKVLAVSQLHPEIETFYMRRG